MAHFHIKRNDLKPDLVAVLNVPGLTSLDECSVKFFAKDRSTGLLAISKAATVVDSAARKIKVEWALADTNRYGLFDFEFEITLPDGKKVSVPNKGYYLMQIDVDIS